MGRDDVTAEWLREVLARHDPLAVWRPGEVHQSDYGREAEMAVSRLRRVLGVGHIWTVVADAIDAGHPGFYRAARADEGELELCLARIAREAWDHHGWAVPRERSLLVLPEGSLPQAPSAESLIDDPATLATWLEEVEAWLEAESDQPNRDARPMGRPSGRRSRTW